MTAIFFNYPKSAAFTRVLPKSKIYEHTNPSTALKTLFIRQVDQITWQFKLASETTNLKGTLSVPEIQIFCIALKTSELKYDVLKCIDQAIPYPILFELHYDGKIRTVAAFKRPSDAVGTNWVVSEYFESAWEQNEVTRAELPIALDLEALYARLLIPLLPFAARSDEGLQNCVERMGQIRTKQHELAKCEARLRKEKQFNRKVAINAELRTLKNEINMLSDHTTLSRSAAAK